VTLTLHSHFSICHPADGLDLFARGALPAAANLLHFGRADAIGEARSRNHITVFEPLDDKAGGK
jgi:hypothetical protein